MTKEDGGLLRILPHAPATRTRRQTRKIIEHGRRIRVCLKQPEFAPVSVPDQVAILLALTGRPFDPVLIERMTEAQQAVREAAPAIPPEVMPV